MVDTHCHLNHPRLHRRLAEVLARAARAGVRQMVIVGYDLPSSELAVALAEQHSGLWAAVGIHPHDAGSVDEQAIARLRTLARSHAVVAIGETGLDYYRDLSPRQAQRDAFQRHLALACEIGLPLIVHCRAKAGNWDAQEAALGMLSSLPPTGVVWHCFDGAPEHARQALSIASYLGFGALLTYRNTAHLAQVAREAPADRLLLETDSPYLSPEPHRSRTNEPANLPTIAQSLARLRGETPQQIEDITTQNAQCIFRPLAR